MERLLIERFVIEEEVEINSPVALLVHSCNRYSLDNIAQDLSTITPLEKYLASEDKVRSGHLGKTASFWFNVIENTRLIIMLQFSIKTNNLT